MIAYVRVSRVGERFGFGGSMPAGAPLSPIVLLHSARSPPLKLRMAYHNLGSLSQLHKVRAL
jgi:hypothetical protein